MAADRVARGRAGADAVLAVDPARGDRLRRSGRLGSAALAHRAGLPGSQAGSRARALRGPRLARLHATLCIAAYGFLIAERARFSPSGPSRAGGRAGGFEAPRLSEGYRPRGAPDPTRAARAELDRHRATTAHRGLGPEPAPMPVLRTHQSEKSQPTRLPLPLVTQ